jgi:hypothetical protein
MASASKRSIIVMRPDQKGQFQIGDILSVPDGFPTLVRFVRTTMSIKILQCLLEDLETVMQASAVGVLSQRAVFLS